MNAITSVGRRIRPTRTEDSELPQQAMDQLAEERLLRQRAEATEKSLRQALLLKDTVIRDVHHRAANTLQIAANVLALQARATASAETRTTLLEGRRRLHLLATVHELLYRNANNAQAILMPPLLDAIGNALQQSFAELRERVELRVSAAPIVLAAEDAIPLALLANEVITNAYKHAFPEQRHGRIAVSLNLAPRDAIVLRIHDNGVGLSRHAMAAGFGTTLIRNFADQLQATIAFGASAHGSGTVVSVRMFRPEKHRPSA